MSLCAAELWRRAGVYRLVRAGCVVSADDSLTMITAEATRCLGAIRRMSVPVSELLIVEPMLIYRF